VAAGPERRMSAPPQGGDGPSALGIVRAKRVGAEEAPLEEED
jgi:hypothetical protein